MDLLEGRSRLAPETGSGDAVEHAGAGKMRGCLLKNFLDMRKRSLIRSESQDSGFSLGIYEPVIPSFDAEKILEELGFAGIKEPLIPDRFIPSLIHRISNMPDETMKQLDTRVWKSIDSFKEKEHRLWFFTNSSMECNLCINHLQRCYSSPAAGSQRSCDSWYPDNDFYFMRSSSNAAIRVQSWLARLRDNSCFAWDGTVSMDAKANIARIGNQPSAESGILSIAGDDEALTESGNIEGDGFSDAPGLLASEMETSQATHVVVLGKSRTSESEYPFGATDEVCSSQTRSTTTFLFSKATAKGQSLPKTTSVFVSSICERSPESSAERRNHNHTVSDIYEISNDENESREQIDSHSLSNTVGTYSYSKPADINIFALTSPSEVVAESDVCDTELGGGFRTQSLKKMATDGQLFLLLPDLDNAHPEGVNDKICHEPEHSNAELDDYKKDDRFSLSVSLSNDRDVNQSNCGFSSPNRKKRHSFDAAYVSISAAEKRKRFKLSHTRSHNFLFEREEASSHPENRVTEVVSDETPPWDSCMLRDLKEASQSRHFVSCHVPEQDTSSQDNSGHTESSSFETSTVASSMEHTDECLSSSRSDSEVSEHYFSCDEFFAENNESCAQGTSDFNKLDVSRSSFDLCLDEQRTASVENVSRTFSKEEDSLRECYGDIYSPNRTFLTAGKENLILNKILRHNLKLSVLGSTGKKSKRSTLQAGRFGNEAEAFSQILNSNDSSTLLKLKELETNVQSLTGIMRTSYDPVRNPDPQVKSIDSRTSDKTKAVDNRLCISKPFVRSPSLPSDMSAPKCEVQLIEYDGLALFWSVRNLGESDINSASGFTDSTHLDSDFSSSGRFTSGIRMIVNSGDEIENTSDRVYFNEVYFEVNGEEAEESPEKKRTEENDVKGKFQPRKDPSLEVQEVLFMDAKTPTNTENPYGRALKDLEDLRLAIQKAKETRMSASRELKLLQELLQGGDNERDATSAERTSIGVVEPTLSSAAVKTLNGNQRDVRNIKALSELQQKSTKDTSQNKEFWGEEQIRKAKEEISQVCHEKLSTMEQKLRTTEEELARALEENGRLREQLELRSSALPICKSNAEAPKSDFSHMNGISDEDPKITLVAKPSIPTKNFWQEYDRLQWDLMKAERKADELNILLNQKVIELNKMQLTLSKQTKEMILLERAYFQLRCHLSKRRLNKSVSSYQSSPLAGTSPTTERNSEDSCRASDPEIPP